MKSFWCSLKNHPGLTLGAIWPLLLLAAIAQRVDLGDIGGAGWAGFAGLAVMPWVAILCTAWAGRGEYRDE